MAEPTMEELINIKSWRDRIALLSRQYEEMRKALEFYADERSWKNNRSPNALHTRAFVDRGDFARRAISPAPSLSETEKSAAPIDDGGWVRVDAEHPLPDDLKIGDEIEIGTPNRRWRKNITSVEVIDGKLFYLVAPNSLWFDAVTGYRRTAGERK